MKHYKIKKENEYYFVYNRVMPKNFEDYLLIFVLLFTFIWIPMIIYRDEELYFFGWHYIKCFSDKQEAYNYIAMLKLEKKQNEENEKVEYL